MKSVFLQRTGKVLRALPDAYTLWPTSDYQAVVSHSAAELTAKAWNRTGEQMQRAIESFERKNPDVKRKLQPTI